MKDFEDPNERIKKAILAIYNREAKENEISESLAYINKMTTYHRENPPDVIQYPTEVKRIMFEEMTGEEFSYTEELDIYTDYVADLQPWQADASTRALGDLIAVYFNSNEFIYVY